MSAFLEVAEQNSYASFVAGGTFSLLQDLNETFLVARDALDGFKADSSSPPLFLMAHSSFLGAVRLGISGQAPESFMVLRGCLERALYAFHLFKNPQLTRVWLSRGLGEKEREASKEEFKTWRVFKTLRGDDMALSDRLGELYERTIDYGAHPNAYSYLTNVEVTVSDGTQVRDLNYLNPASDSFELCLRSSAQVGVIVLLVFAKIFGMRFELLGVIARVERLAKGL